MSQSTTRRAWLALQLAHDRVRPPFPAELVVAADADVVDEPRTKTGHALAALMADASIDDAVRAGVQQRSRQALRRAVVVRIVDGGPTAHRPDVVKARRQIGKVDAQLHPRLVA